MAHFVAVAEEGSFTRAARRAHIVQSGISASIASLERELDVPLFRRTKQRAELTEAGGALLVEARRALAAVAAGTAAATASRGSLSGSLKLHVVSSALALLQLPRALHEFRLAHPGVTLTVHEMQWFTFDGLRDGTYDLSIAPSRAPAGITSVELGRSPLGVVCSESHPIARRRFVTLRGLAHETIIDVPAGSATRTLVDRAFDDLGIVRHRSVECTGTALLTSFLQEGFGIVIAPRSFARMAPHITWVPVRPALPPWLVTASFLGDAPANPVAHAFLKALKRGPAERRR